MISIQPDTRAAYRLMHDGILTLAEIERTGMRIDVNYCKRQIGALDRRIERLGTLLHETKDVLEWKAIYKDKFNLDSPRQLADYLYKHRGLTPVKTTEKGNASVDDESLKAVKEPFVQDLLRIRRLKKTRDTYLKGILSEVSDDGLLHPFFNLNSVATYRSCIAVGSLVLAVRDFRKQGIPIEEIREGDLVYCFDNKLHPVIRKVLWAGKTGRRQVIRIHWIGGYGNRRRGFLDLTPEHLVRHISGKYVEAQNLVGNLRSNAESRRSPKIRVLSACRYGDRLSFTGHSAVLEHQFVYSQLIGQRVAGEHIHHKDGDHFNHLPENLEKTDLSNHASIHVSQTVQRESVRKKAVETLRRGWKEGRYRRRYGSENPSYLGLTKIRCLRLLSAVRGKYTAVRGIDFRTFRKYLYQYQIDPKFVKLRYDKHGRYISKGYRERGIDLGGGNHQITQIEWLDEEADVYDLEIEEFNNFFANEICVHNSSNAPNFQNLPIRDKEMGKIIRQAFIPRPGHRFGGIDISGAEVRLAACYHHDTTMLEYIRNPSSDMHRDMAMECYKLRQDQVNKTSRYCAKNKFVFPQFYGDWYKSCAASLWGAIDEMDLQTAEGVPMREHLRSQNIKNYNKFEDHIKQVEDRFWNDRFPAYTEWKQKWIKQYERTGKIHMLTGFTCSGVMRRNAVVNYPVQGTAFHCLLWSVIRLHDWLKREKMQSKIVGQIHDEITGDFHAEELEVVLKRARVIMCEEIRREWDWLVVPLEIESSFAPIDRSWYEKEIIS